MSEIEFQTPADMPPTNGYSHVAVVPPGMRLVWTSGQVAMTPDREIVGSGDWEAQTRLAFQNIGDALAAAGASWSDVFKLTIFVTDTEELPTVRRVRDEFVDAERPPTSTLVRVAGLFRPDVLIEVEAVAAVRDRGDQPNVL